MKAKITATWEIEDEDSCNLCMLFRMNEYYTWYCCKYGVLAGMPQRPYICKEATRLQKGDRVDKDRPKRKFVTFEITEDVYPLTAPQAAQIDCRVYDCRFWKRGGECGNTAPAITLNPEPEGYTCWSRNAD